MRISKLGHIVALNFFLVKLSIMFNHVLFLKNVKKMYMLILSYKSGVKNKKIKQNLFNVNKIYLSHFSTYVCVLYDNV